MTKTYPTKINSLLAEEIGLHIGDGCLNYYKGKGFYQLRGHLLEDKDHYLTRIKPLYERLFGIKVNIRDMKSTGVCGFQVWNNKLADYKDRILNLPLGRKVNFVIPERILKSKTLSKSFLRGYFDTDGCFYLEKKRHKLYPRVEMASVSKDFIEQVTTMLRSLGFNFSSYVEIRKHQNWNNLNRIIIRGEKMTDKWFSEINPANSKHWKKYQRYKGGPAAI